MKISDASACFYDCETHAGPNDGPKLVEFAYVDRSAHFSSLVNPGVPITPEASGVHLIVDEDVAAAPSVDGLWGALYEARGATKYDVMVAHNDEFDKAIVPWFVSGFPTLCTMRLAKHLLANEDADKRPRDFKLGTLRFWFRLKRLDFPLIPDPLRPGEMQPLGPHRALYDCIVGMAVFRALADLCLEKGARDDLDALIAYAASPIIYKYMQGWKKYEGWKVRDVDRGALEWMLKNRDDLDPDVRATLVEELKRREKVSFFAQRGAAQRERSGKLDLGL